MPTTNGHAVNTGCVLSAPFGWHNHKRMIDVAIDLGYEVSVEDIETLERYDSGDEVTNDAEDVTEMMDEAERWLNEHTPAECRDCGQPVESHPTGWWSHIGLRGQCWRLSDGESVQGYLWHWSDGEFYLSPICDDAENCDDDTCAHWSFQ